MPSAVTVEALGCNDVRVVESVDLVFPMKIALDLLLTSLGHTKYSIGLLVVVPLFLDVCNVK